MKASPVQVYNFIGFYGLTEAREQLLHQPDIREERHHIT